MFKRLLILAAISVCVIGIGLQLEDAPSALAQKGELCKEQSDSEIVCGFDCENDWYDWYSRETSGYWDVTISSESHCEDCCEETCYADTAIAYSDPCWCDGTTCD